MSQSNQNQRLSSLEKVKNQFTEVVRLVDKTMGDNYAVKNPGLVQHLINTIQSEEDRQSRFLMEDKSLPD